MRLQFDKCALFINHTFKCAPTALYVFSVKFGFTALRKPESPDSAPNGMGWHHMWPIREDEAFSHLPNLVSPRFYFFLNGPSVGRVCTMSKMSFTCILLTSQKPCAVPQTRRKADLQAPRFLESPCARKPCFGTQLYARLVCIFLQPRRAAAAWTSSFAPYTPQISTAIMDIDRGEDGDADPRSGQSPGGREMPSPEELEDRVDNSRSAQRGCVRCRADGLEVYFRWH